MADRTAICMTITCPVAGFCQRSALEVPPESTLKGVEKIHPRAHRPGAPCPHYDGEPMPLVAGGQGRSGAAVRGCGECLGWFLAAGLALIVLALLILQGRAGL